MIELSEFRVVEVTPGDTLSGIGHAFGVSVAALADVNRIADPNHIEVGWILLVPVVALEPPAEEPAVVEPDEPVEPTGTMYLDLDFGRLTADGTLTHVEFQLIDAETGDGPTPSPGGWAPGFNDGRVSIVTDTPPGGSGGSALRIDSPRGSYGVQLAGASTVYDLDDWGDPDPDSTVVNEGIYAAGLDEAWIEVEMFWPDGFGWNTSVANSWKQWGGFLLGPPKDTRWKALGSPGGHPAQRHGRNTGGQPGNGEWWSGGSTRWTSKDRQPADPAAGVERGGISTVYVYHADQAGAYGDHLYYTVSADGAKLHAGSPGSGALRNPRAAGGVNTGGRYLTFPEGRWVLVGQRCKLNTPGRFDGEVEQYVDGVSRGICGGIRWRGSAEQNASGLDARWGIQAAALYHFPGGHTAKDNSLLADTFHLIRRVRVGDFDFVTRRG